MEKRIFIDRFLKPLLKALDSNVASVRYMKSANSEEYVIVTYNSGYSQNVCITADSNKSIVMDVISAIAL